MIDSSSGLAAALREQWPSLVLQRCITYKLRNLDAKVSVRLREEIADYRRMIYDESHARRSRPRSIHEEAVAALSPRSSNASRKRAMNSSLPLSFPKTQWKALRTTNALERINRTFRRRTKTQVSLLSQSAILLLLFGLLRSGQVKMRKIDRWHEMERVKAAA